VRPHLRSAKGGRVESETHNARLPSFSTILYILVSITRLSLPKASSEEEFELIGESEASREREIGAKSKNLSQNSEKSVKS